MKNPLKAIKARLANYQKPATTIQRTSLSNFTPNVAPGLEIAVAMIRGDTIEVHYKQRGAQ